MGLIGCTSDVLPHSVTKVSKLIVILPYSAGLVVMVLVVMMIVIIIVTVLMTADWMGEAE